MTKLQQIREPKNISREVLALKSGIKYHTLYAVEIGQRKFSRMAFESVCKLADALDVSVDDLKEDGK